MDISHPIRLAVLVGLVAVAAGQAPALLAFYLTLLCAAAFLGLASVAHLRAVDDPRPGTVAEAGACAAMGLLTVAAAALRFPGIGAGDSTSASDALVRAALAIAIAGLIVPLVVEGRRRLAAGWTARSRSISRARQLPL